MKILVGDTGLVGTTLKKTISFDYVFNSTNLKDINSIDTTNSDVYLSCLPATKWMVNKDVLGDLKNIIDIVDILKKNNFKNIILISTIDVYCNSPKGADEEFKPIVNEVNYGTNRYFFELLIEKMVSCNNLKIFRLPSLFNDKIKKNILFDLLNKNNLQNINKNSQYQWYNLDKLSKDIEIFSDKFPKSKIFNLFTEPIETEELLNMFPVEKQEVTLYGTRIEYDFKTKHNQFGYVKTKEEVLNELENFVYEVSNQ
jgi:hypothetical protein